jgi:glutamate transport system permease protein
VSIALSLLIGTVLASVRLSLGRYARMPLVAVIELLRGLPVVVSIFYASRVLPDLGVRLDTFWYLVIGLVAYNSVIVSEIVRAGVVSLPRGQVEAGLAIGLTRGQTLRIIQLPQAFRVMLPAVISQLIVVLKDTALAAVVLTGFSELMNEAGFVRLNLDNPLQTFTVVALIFITINYSLGRLAQWTEKRLSRSSGGADEAAAAHAAENAAEARTGA